MRTITRYARTFSIMFILPPLALLAAAHLTPGLLSTDVVSIPFAMILMAAGLAAVATSGWPLPVRIGVGLTYGMVAIVSLPFLALLAVCTTGNCL